MHLPGSLASGQHRTTSVCISRGGVVLFQIMVPAGNVLPALVCCDAAQLAAAGGVVAELPGPLQRHSAGKCQHAGPPRSYDLWIGLQPADSGLRRSPAWFWATVLPALEKALLLWPITLRKLESAAPPPFPVSIAHLHL